jgi:hypothetical protein
MKQYLDFSDSRHNNGCILCGSYPDSRDHIPARTFLNKPYPSNLNVLPVCTSCNNGFSQDEEYVSFLVRYLKYLESDDENDYLGIEKFSHADILEERILNGLCNKKDKLNPTMFINIEVDRIKNILNKYAFAHFCFERGEHPNREKTQTNFAFVNQLTDDQIKLYNEIPYSKILPEVGSRLFQRVIENGDSWMIVQDSNYRYYVAQNKPYVKIVISEFLFGETVFNDS